MPILDLSTQLEFRPLVSSRRGELYAWTLTLIVLFVLRFVPELQGIYFVLGIFLAVFFGLSAVLISLINWMERATVLEVHADGVAFRNGLRKVDLAWDDVIRIEVAQRPSGRRVQVLGKQAHFAFYTQGAVKLGNRTGEPSGFEQGEAILETILQKTSLTRTPTSTEDVYYYARE